MPTPPAAGSRWYSIRSSVTRASGVRASNVAALMTRLRSVSGPSWAGANTSGAVGLVVIRSLGLGEDFHAATVSLTYVVVNGSESGFLQRGIQILSREVVEMVDLRPVRVLIGGIHTVPQRCACV